MSDTPIATRPPQGREEIAAGALPTPPPGFPGDAAGAALLIAKHFKADPESRIAAAVAAERERIRLELLDLIESEGEEVNGWTCNQIGECNLSAHRARLVDADALRAFARRLETKP